MPEPGTLAALGVAIGKLLLRWGDLNDTADALEDARAGFRALRALDRSKAKEPISAAITELLEQRLAGVRDPGRRHEMTIAVANVADLFAGLTDSDIRAAAQYPEGFPSYVARGAGRTLLARTEEALTPFTAQLIAAGAATFAELAPRSGRFTAAALVRLLNQVGTALAGMTDIQEQITVARDYLLAAQERVAQRVDALHPKVDDMRRQLEEVLRLLQPPGPAAAAASAPIGQWDPLDLGVHDSITVHGEAGLTPYLARDHDHRLRQILEQAAAGDRPSLVLVVGTSCSGKTRTLYEAVLDVLPDWAVTAPCGASALARTLTADFPARTIVWLDELQDQLPATPAGITAARALTELLVAPVGPIVVAGTLWPTNLAAMRARPTPDKAHAGAGAIPTLLARGTVITVPDTFTHTELQGQNAVDDPRIRKAIDTAAADGHPDGRKITQVLAGGAQLVSRLYPQTSPPGDVFSRAASALLRAAGDLRRVGMPNPLPRWAIEGAAPGYLDPPDCRPPDQWLPAAFEEATQAARDDDTLAGTRTHDHHRQGIPALTPHWTTDDGGTLLEGYDLHDYLLQDHLERNFDSEIANSLWTTLTSRPGHGGWALAMMLSQSARRRGLISHAINLLEPWLQLRRDAFGSFVRLQIWRGVDDRMSWELLEMCQNSAERRIVAGRLAEAGLDSGWLELRSGAVAGIEESAAVLARSLARRRRSSDLQELQQLREDGDSHAAYELLRLGSRQQESTTFDHLRDLRRSGDRAAGERLYYMLSKRATAEDLRELAGYANQGDDHAQMRLDEALASCGDDAALRRLTARALAGGAPSQRRLARALARRGDAKSIDMLRARADAGEGSAQHHLARWLARQDDEASFEELRLRTLQGDESARALYIDRLVLRRDIEGLKSCVRAGYRLAAKRLIALYRRDTPDVTELDNGGGPVRPPDGSVPSRLRDGLRGAV